MRTIRMVIAAVLLVACLLYVAFGEHKGWGIGAALIVAFLCRWLVIDQAAVDEAERRGAQRVDSNRE